MKDEVWKKRSYNPQKQLLENIRRNQEKGNGKFPHWNANKFSQDLVEETISYAVVDLLKSTRYSFKPL